MIERKKPILARACASFLALAAGCAADAGSADTPRAQASAGTGGLAGAGGAAASSVTAGAGPLPAIAAGSGAPAAAVSGVAGLAGRPAAGSGAVGLPRAGAPGGGRPGTGAAGAAPMAPVVSNPKDCPAAPADATPQAATALAAVNSVRVASGAACVNLVNTISDGATAHCNYYALYTKGDMCIANPHGEVMSCRGFSGASPGARSKAAGYTGGGGGEVMAFLNNAQRALDTWVNSVWHRTPILDPSTYDLGYGFAASGCDVIDFGRGMAAPATALVVYPYDTQVDVPPAFNGALEGPMPPAPPSGWPSGLPVSVHGKGLAITEHVITRDGDAAPIEHTWLDANSTNVDASMKPTLKSVNFLYTHTALAPNTKYHVKLSGSYAGGALTKEWSFTTGAARRF